MEHFCVDGTTLLSWTIQVPAYNEVEAREEAQRILGWIDLPSSLATLHRAEHRVAGCRLSDPESE